LPETHRWWQHGIVYQIYPRSFMDSNGDGVGDLSGITQRLDYLRWLGVDAIWLSPIYPSPMADFGYDVSDFIGIDPLFGTLADFDGLVAAAHTRGLKVILDYIPNHSSERHPWFLDSRSSRGSPKRDWYIWREPGPNGEPPNNWLSNFGGSAWSLDTATRQYYYHAYLPEQPDLNWRNSEVQAAMLEAMRFWLERGVDGFRIDALRQLIKDDRWRDNPPNLDWRLDQGPYQSLLPVYTTDRPELMTMVESMRRLVDAYDDRVLIGELYLPIERLVVYYGTKGSGIHLPFNFHLISTPWKARAVARLIEQYEAALPADGWPNWVLGNHDQHRLASRIGPAQARVAAMLLLTLRGTPTLYYGDEIGMQDVPIAPERVRDPWERNVPGLGLGRDPERTPMQWNDSGQAGFSQGEPWLPIADTYDCINVARQSPAPRSLLTLYRRLIDLRRNVPALAVAPYQGIPSDGNLLAYLRDGGGLRLLVGLNLGGAPVTLPVPGGTGRVLLSTQLDRENESAAGTLSLRGDEGLIVELAPA
jgi:alpha-glucosidase